MFTYVPSFHKYIQMHTNAYLKRYDITDSVTQSAKSTGISDAHRGLATAPLTPSKPTPNESVHHALEEPPSPLF